MRLRSVAGITMVLFHIQNKDIKIENCVVFDWRNIIRSMQETRSSCQRCIPPWVDIQASRCARQVDRILAVKNPGVLLCPGCGNGEQVVPPGPIAVLLQDIPREKGYFTYQLPAYINTLKHCCICQWWPDKPCGRNNLFEWPRQNTIIIVLNQCFVLFSGFISYIHQFSHSFHDWWTDIKAIIWMAQCKWSGNLERFCGYKFDHFGERGPKMVAAEFSLGILQMCQ